MSVQVLSVWMAQPAVTQPMTDEERHAVFSRFAVGVADAQMPWLLPLLEQAGATVYVAPSVFAFRLPSQPEQWHEITALSHHIAMVPWVEGTQTQQ